MDCVTVSVSLCRTDEWEEITLLGGLAELILVITYLDLHLINKGQRE